MWIFLKDAFLSVVDKECAAHELLVRARVKGDIERVFPRAKVVEGAGTDYRFRAVVTRHEIVVALADEVRKIGYRNFKSAVKDGPRHDAYMGVWTAMDRLQERMMPKAAKPKQDHLWGDAPKPDWLTNDEHRVVADRFFTPKRRKAARQKT